MARRLSREEKREKVFVELVNHMFIIAGYNVTYNDILGKDDWYMNYTMTVQQGEEFKEWGKKHLMKEHRLSSKLAEREMLWFNVQWGLTYSNWEEYHTTK